MTEPSPYKVPLSELLKVKVPEEEQVEERDPTPPAPDLATEAEKRRIQALRTGA